MNNKIYEHAKDGDVVNLSIVLDLPHAYNYYCYKEKIKN